MILIDGSTKISSDMNVVSYKDSYYSSWLDGLRKNLQNLNEYNRPLTTFVTIQIVSKIPNWSYDTHLYSKFVIIWSVCKYKQKVSSSSKYVLQKQYFVLEYLFYLHEWNN